MKKTTNMKTDVKGKQSQSKMISLDKKDWFLVFDSSLETGEKKCRFRNNQGSLHIKNKYSEKKKVQSRIPVTINDENCKYLRIVCEGISLKNAGGCVYLNDYSININSVTIMPVNIPQTIVFSVIVSADSEFLLQKISVTALDEKEELIDYCDEKADVLVVVPNYPSAENLYLSAFAHARNRAYLEEGLRIQVASLSDFWYTMVYDIDGIPVYKGHTADLKRLIARKQYKVIVIHFVGPEHYTILDGFISNEKLVFICHGPEVIFEILPNKVRPYFTEPLPDRIVNKYHTDYVKKYAAKDNVEWVFVSEWLQNKAEETIGIQFKNASVIGNFINEKLFPYREKKAEDRKNILILRKFDNVCQHSIDQVVYAVSELSRKPFFSELHFEVYGDGNYYDELVAPLRRYENVSLYRTFIPQGEIKNIHAGNGILLLPSRHDAHAVSMSEGASSGLVVVGSNVTSNPYYMDDEHNHTMVDPEDPVALAGVIERLYYHPDEFLDISRRLSDFVHTVSSRKNTIEREISLIKSSLSELSIGWDQLPHIKAEGGTVLSVVVEVTKGGSDLSRCLYTILNHRNASRMEVLLAVHGSERSYMPFLQPFIKAAEDIIHVIPVVEKKDAETITCSIDHARGRYLHMMKEDGWADSESLAQLIDLLEEEMADIVLTKGRYDYKEKAVLEGICDYNMLAEGRIFYSEDLTFPHYGFETYDHIPINGSWRLDTLKATGYILPYELTNSNSQTLVYHNLDVFRASGEGKKEKQADEGSIQQAGKKTHLSEGILLKTLAKMKNIVFRKSLPDS